MCDLENGPPLTVIASSFLGGVGSIADEFCP